MDELKDLKSKILAHQAKFGKRRAFPKDVWNRIHHLSQSTSSSIIAKELGISPANLTRQLERRQKENAKEVSLLEVPIGFLGKKQMTLELPHNFTLRIEL